MRHISAAGGSNHVFEDTVSASGVNIMICIFLKRFDDQGTLFKVVVHERIDSQFVFMLACRFNDRITAGALHDALQVALDDYDFGVINRLLNLGFTETTRLPQCYGTRWRIRSRRQRNTKDPLDGSDFEVVLTEYEWDSIVATMFELLERRVFDPESDPEFPD